MHDHNSNGPPLPLLCNIALWLAVFTACVLTIHVCSSAFLSQVVIKMDDCFC